MSFVVFITVLLAVASIILAAVVGRVNKKKSCADKELATRLIVNVVNVYIPILLLLLMIVVTLISSWRE